MSQMDNMSDTDKIISKAQKVTYTQKQQSEIRPTYGTFKVIDFAA